MCTLTPMFPSNQQDQWYFTTTMEYPKMSQDDDSFTHNLPSFLYPLDDYNNIINLTSLSNSNGTNSNNNNGMVLEKKLNHNASERDRRRKLNVLYSSLRALLPPSDQKRKMSIPMTISRVVKFIPEQKQELQHLSCMKDKLLKRISRKIVTLNHHQEQLRNKAMMDSIDSMSSKIAATWLTNTEIAVQIATSSWTSISDMLLRLEVNGFNVISVSSSVSSTARIFYNLHLEMRGDWRVNLEELNDIIFGLSQSYQ